MENYSNNNTTMPDADASGNRVKRVKKRRRKKKKSPLVVIATTVVVLLVCLIISIVAFSVKILEIEGNKRVTNDEVKELIHWDESQGSTVLLWLMNLRVDVSDNPLLSRIKVVIDDPWSITVQVKEHALVACIREGGYYYYMNNEGLVIVSQSQSLTNVPTLTGLVVKDATVGEYLETKDDDLLSDMLSVAKWVESYDLDVDTIEEASEGGLMITIGDVRVLLGRNINMEEKISELSDLIEQLEGLDGTLHLEDYDSSKDSIVFTYGAEDAEEETEEEKSVMED